jgi:hypothetical protein
MVSPTDPEKARLEAHNNQRVPQQLAEFPRPGSTKGPHRLKATLFAPIFNTAGRPRAASLRYGARARMSAPRVVPRSRSAIAYATRFHEARNETRVNPTPDQQARDDDEQRREELPVPGLPGPP